MLQLLRVRARARDLDDAIDAETVDRESQSCRVVLNDVGTRPLDVGAQRLRRWDATAKGADPCLGSRLARRTRSIGQHAAGPARSRTRRIGLFAAGIRPKRSAPVSRSHSGSPNVVVQRVFRSGAA